MPTTTTMTVEHGKCRIYPTRQMQFCSRVQVIVRRLKPGDNADAEWVPEEESERDVTLLCSERGMERLLKGIDNATSAPTTRTRTPKDNTQDAHK